MDWEREKEKACCKSSRPRAILQCWRQQICLVSDSSQLVYLSSHGNHPTNLSFHLASPSTVHHMDGRTKKCLLTLRFMEPLHGAPECGFTQNLAVQLHNRSSMCVVRHLVLRCKAAAYFLKDVSLSLRERHTASKRETHRPMHTHTEVQSHMYTHKHTHTHTHTHTQLSAKLEGLPSFCLEKGVYDSAVYTYSTTSFPSKTPAPFISGSRPHPVYLRHRLCFMKSKIFNWLYLSAQTH